MSRYHESLVNRFTSDELHIINKLVNARIAESIGVPVPTLIPSSDRLTEYLTELGHGDREFEGVRTGMEQIDRLIGGLHKFVMLGARAGAGKTTLAVQLALGALQTNGTPVLFYSFEMARSDVHTMMMQNLRRGTDYPLSRREIVLHGNSPISSNSGAAIKESGDALQALADRIFIIDATDGPPNIDRITADIEQLQDIFKTKDVLIIIDSLQDLVEVGSGGATVAEAELCQHIVEIQQATGATFLTISQKAKSGSFEDPYAGMLGSVSLMHKPTAVIELLSVYDLMRQLKDRDVIRTFAKLADLSDVPNPVIARVTKGRNNGHGHVNLMHYGRNGYFEEGKVRDFDVNTETSIYDQLGF